MEETRKRKTVKVCGVEYQILFVREIPEIYEAEPDTTGLTVPSEKRIYIKDGPSCLPHAAGEEFIRQILRHEIVHAHLHESGLHDNSIDGWAVNEEMVDWIAIQLPKMVTAMEEVLALL